MEDFRSQELEQTVFLFFLSEYFSLPDCLTRANCFISNHKLSRKWSKKLNTASINKILLVIKPTSQTTESTRRQHIETVSVVRSALDSTGIEYGITVRGKPGRFEVNHDLVITIGGDGTFLDASHSIASESDPRKRVPLFGVNSAPGSSFGNYCNATAANFQIMLERILSGKEYCHDVARLSATIDQKPVEVPVLNELLVAGQNAGATARYDLEVNGVTSSQRSSGLIVATPSGTTGFLHSAGGEVIALNSRKFAYQVLARFGLPEDRFDCNSGFVSFGDKIVVESQMGNGKIYIDGPHIEHAFKRGSRLVISVDPNPLRAYVSPYRHHDYDEYQLRCRRLPGQAIA